MTARPFSFFAHLRVICFTGCVLLTACRGGELCGPTSDPVSDVDGDCIEDSSDDCPLDYNAGQVDLDGDGLGNVCDVDDADSTIGPALVTDITRNVTDSLDLLPDYPDPVDHAAPNPDDANCQRYLLSCNGQFLGYFNDNAADPASLADNEGDFGNSDSEISILNPMGFYGRATTSCSAFNTQAEWPPALFCLDSNGESTFAGYLTRNVDITDGIDACDTLAMLDLFHPECE